MPTFTETVTMTTIECGQCGVMVAMTDEFIDRRRKDHRDFYCPNGHTRYFPAESDVEKARRLQRAAEQETASVREALAAERKAHTSTKGALTKTRNRIQHGVCPECHRSFENVARHMATKHPAPAP